MYICSNYKKCIEINCHSKQPILHSHLPSLDRMVIKHKLKFGCCENKPSLIKFKPEKSRKKEG